jgi:sterol desaturase/sphingolipid hydroxylase (fatty acid hydroxylase superfamily)
VFSAILQEALQGIQTYYLHIFAGGTVALLLELALPRSTYSLLSRLRAGLFLFVYVLITSSFFAAFNAVWARTGIRPLLVVDLSWMSGYGPWALRVTGVFLAVVASAYLLEFFYYWFHRMQHAVPLFWRFHAVHHSIKELSGWNCYHHATEEIFRIPFVIIPVLAIVSINPGFVPIWIPVITAAQGQFEHSCTRVHFGWLRYLIADNRYHRIHHSIEPGHIGKNFGSFTPIWDWCFGTAHFPASTEWPETGLVDVAEPRTLREYLLRPFGSSSQASLGAASTVSRSPGSSIRHSNELR